ncbi:MAG: serine/threonine protein kinase [Calothrix sp. FI2-JRJ7]|jgi:serine/threonine-protein kinase|nr:serine/threonine protein kinase [Calothrix sp. FI2-JRJ7]
MDSPSIANWIGRSLGDNNRYRLDKVLGAGGMGDVFLAMDTRIGKQVALKILKDTLVESQEIRKRFEREIEICAALDSEHIVQVSDSGVTVEGYPFYVMEYLRGQSLRQLLLRSKRLPVERTINIITQVCKGLQRAHQGVYLERQHATRSERIQVVHRDLKPDNIFLANTDSGDLVKIVDFGIAKIRNESFEQTHLTSAFLGTLRYASPEQLRGAINIDGRSDIYSLGIILYETLSGADPFGFSIKARNYSEASWIFAHTSESPKPLRAQPGCENLPAQLEAIVMQCLHKEPEKRFASVEELHLALQNFLISLQSGSPASIREETISQIHITTNNDSCEETIARPISLEPKVQREETIFQPASVSNSHVVRNHEETIYQKPKNYSVTLIISIVLFATACISGFFAYPFFTSRQALDKIKEAQNQANYEQCIALSEKVSLDSSIYSESQEILNKCRQDYAIKLANEKDCVKASEVNEKSPKPLFEQIQAQINSICDEPLKGEPSGQAPVQPKGKF